MLRNLYFREVSVCVWGGGGIGTPPVTLSGSAYNLCICSKYQNLVCWLKKRYFIHLHTNMFQRGDNQDAGQTARMRRLICAFVDHLNKTKVSCDKA